ncbi:MAG: hypothetical protein RLZZ398_220 [Verrucomicrobiota bacterium]
MKEPKLNRHRELIHRIHRGKKSIRQTWIALNAEGVVVAYDTLREWLGKNPGSAVIPKLGKGRRRTPESPLFRLLPRNAEEISANDPSTALFTTFLPCPDDFRIHVLMEALAASGVDFDPCAEFKDLLIPGRLLAQLGDLEICLLTYLLSDMQPPVGQPERGFPDWAKILTIRAAKLKARFRAGSDATVAELRAIMRGG